MKPIHKPFIIIHNPADSPVVELHSDIYANKGTAYLVSSLDYKISKTEEQFQKRIADLELALAVSESKIMDILKVLLPEEYSDQ